MALDRLFRGAIASPDIPKHNQMPHGLENFAPHREGAARPEFPNAATQPHRHILNKNRFISSRSHPEIPYFRS
ncbi:MAG: hypothetical protein ACYTXI_19690 [Nostoc sp.]